MAHDLNLHLKRHEWYSSTGSELDWLLDWWKGNSYMKWYMMYPLQEAHRHKDIRWTKNGLNYTVMVSLQPSQGNNGEDNLTSCFRIKIFLFITLSFIKLSYNLAGDLGKRCKTLCYMSLTHSAPCFNHNHLLQCLKFSQGRWVLMGTRRH